MKKIVFGIIVAICVFLAFGYAILALCSRGEIKNYRYTSKVQASESISKGWIPQAIPDDSYDIYVKYDLDTNRVWMTFKTIEGISEESLTYGEDVKSLRVNKVLETSENIEHWWSSYLNDLQALNNRSNLIIYKFDYTNTDRDQYFVIDTRASPKYLQVYYYSVIKVID